jgi:hypothetical protein
MALKIPANQIKNLQQIEVVVSGPDEANRLIIIDGQFDTGNIAADSLNRTNKQTFSVLLGPKLTNRQFLRAIATASFARTQTFGNTMCNIWDVDADWDDESGQVELKIEAEMGAFSASGHASMKCLSVSCNYSCGCSWSLNCNWHTFPPRLRTLEISQDFHA